MLGSTPHSTNLSTRGEGLEVVELIKYARQAQSMSKFVFCKSESCRKLKSRIGIEGKQLPKEGSPRPYRCLKCNEEFQYEVWDVRDEGGRIERGNASNQK